MAKILVIEDHHPLRNEIAEVLTLSGYDVVQAADGAEGVKIAKETLPELILCDIMMNNMDGYEVLQNIRKTQPLITVPFIFITAKSDRASMRHGMALGADDFVTKPFTAAELLEAIHVRMNKHNMITTEAQRNVESAKKQLMHMVTHELRTPLASINMVLDIISRQISYLSPNELQEMLDTLGSGSKRLNRVVEQIVLITQLEAGILDPKTIRDTGMETPLWEILVAAIALARRFAYRIPDVGIDLTERDKSAHVICHLAALKHALAELIANALNFSPEGSNIHISQWQADDRVWISITDTGKGIAPDQLQKALIAFEQINRAQNEQQDMGLGLGLAHHLIKAHRGTLQLKSVPDKGTQAIISLPMIKPTT